MVSDAFNSLTRRILTLPKGTAEVHFCFTSPLSPLSSDPSCQLLNTNCWFSVCPFLHTDFWEERCFKEERLFEKDAQSCFYITPLKCNPTHSSQKSFSSLFFVKNCSAISTREICDENDCSRENDLWLKCARERCNVTSQGGAWSLVIFLGQTCPQTWPMRTMSDLTCIFPVRMCNHSLDIYYNYTQLHII